MASGFLFHTRVAQLPDPFRILATRGSLQPEKRTCYSTVNLAKTGENLEL